MIISWFPSGVWQFSWHFKLYSDIHWCSDHDTCCQIQVCITFCGLTGAKAIASQSAVQDIYVLHYRFVSGDSVHCPSCDTRHSLDCVLCQALLHACWVPVLVSQFSAHIYGDVNPMASRCLKQLSASADKILMFCNCVTFYCSMM